MHMPYLFRRVRSIWYSRLLCSVSRKRLLQTKLMHKQVIFYQKKLSEHASIISFLYLDTDSQKLPLRHREVERKASCHTDPQDVVSQRHLRHATHPAWAFLQEIYNRYHSYPVVRAEY